MVPVRRRQRPRRGPQHAARPSGWDRAGWTTDQTSTLIGDAQLGVGWRKGALQTSLGYIHRQVKGAHMLYGVEAHDDSMVAFSLSLKPRR
jgi:hypothetical protein